MKMIRTVLAIALALSVVSIRAQTFHEVKTWKFKLPHGSLEIVLRSYSDGWASLGIRPYDQIPEAPISEQVEPLRQVLAEMPSLGLDPRKLATIETHLWASDVRNRLAYMCVDSREWQQSMHSGGTGKERLVVELLNRSGVYDGYNEVFRQYGIQMQVTEAEAVGLMPFSRVPARNVGDRVNARLLVPADAMIGMRFSRVDKK
jgi:hypothetical protein